MSWTCPVCGRGFRNASQSHSCRTKTVEDHFSKAPDEISSAYARLAEEVSKFGTVRISPVTSAILFAARSNFLSVKVKKDRLDVEFLLDREAPETFIDKTVVLSKTRVAHFVRITSPADVSPQLVRILRESYDKCL